MSGDYVTVIIPCFNAEETIKATIESALDQKGVELEVIVIDDGSTDRSLEVIETFKSDISIVTGPNQGVSGARNFGIRAGRGEWFVFLDADDLLSRGTLRRRVDVGRESDAQVVMCDWEEFSDERGTACRCGVQFVNLSVLEADAELACACSVWLPTAALTYRRAIIQSIGGFRTDLPIIQDARFLFDAAYHGARFARSEHVGARYRVQSQGLSRRDPARFWQDVLVNGKQIETLWRARSSLSVPQREALHAIFYNSARGLFSVAHSDYFDAIASLRRLGLRLPRHSRIATPLARAIGISFARQVLRIAGR